MARTSSIPQAFPILLLLAGFAGAHGAQAATAATPIRSERHDFRVVTVVEGPQNPCRLPQLTACDVLIP